jgi:hypothetical protein
MIHRMEEAQQPTSKLARSEGFLEPARVQQRALNDLEEDIERPFGVVTSDEDLPKRKG